MSSNFPSIPSNVQLPLPPKSSAEVLPWALGLTKAIQHMNRTISTRAENLLLEGALASRPAADGSRRFYYATDTDTLYYDDAGTWVAIGGLTGPVVNAYAPGSFTIPTGKYAVMSNFLQLTGTQQGAVAGTGRLRIT